MLKTRLCQLLGIEHPIFSVGMGTWARPELAPRSFSTALKNYSRSSRAGSTLV